MSQKDGGFSVPRVCSLKAAQPHPGPRHHHAQSALETKPQVKCMGFLRGRVVLQEGTTLSTSQPWPGEEATVSGPRHNAHQTHVFWCFHLDLFFCLT